MFIIMCVSFIDDYKHKDFVDINGTIVNRVVEDEMYFYTISYTIGGENYTADRVFGVSDYEIGEVVAIRYNPNDVHSIMFKSDSFDIVYYGVMILFLCSILSIIKNVRNLLHYINPSKYDFVPNTPFISFGVGDSEEDISNGNSGSHLRV